MFFVVFEEFVVSEVFEFIVDVIGEFFDGFMVF